MNPVHRRKFNRTSNRNRQPSPTPPTHQITPLNPSNCPTSSWTTHDSNLALLACLSTATPNRPALPTELILQILNHPTRWVLFHSVNQLPAENPDQTILRIRNKPTGIPVLFTRPFSAREAKLVQKIVLEFRSRDQGYSEHPDRGTWSWFEASLVQLPSTDDEHDEQGQVSDVAVWTGSYDWIGKWMVRHKEKLEDQPRYKIQENRHAEITPKHYAIELTDEYELVQRVQEGDRIILWACACFPGWENRVYEAKISVLGLDDLTVEMEKCDQ